MRRQDSRKTYCGTTRITSEGTSILHLAGHGCKGLASQADEVQRCFSCTAPGGRTSFEVWRVLHCSRQHLPEVYSCSLQHYQKRVLASVKITDTKIV